MMRKLLFFLFLTTLPLAAAPKEEAIKKAEAATTEEETSSKEKKIVKGREITLRDFGADDLGFLSLPLDAPQYGVLILPDSGGLNENVQAFCDEVASKKAIALAVDLFNGKVAQNAEEAAQMQRALRPESARKTIDAALSLLTESPRLRADKVVIATLGSQYALVMKPDERLEKKIVGMTWFEPFGAVQTEQFRKWNLPIQIIISKSSSAQVEFVKALHEHMIPEREKITFVEQHFAPNGFLLATSPSNEQKSALDQAAKFWQRCAEGAYLKERNVFQKFIDSIVN